MTATYTCKPNMSCAAEKFSAAFACCFSDELNNAVITGAALAASVLFVLLTLDVTLIITLALLLGLLLILRIPLPVGRCAAFE